MTADDLTPRRVLWLVIQHQDEMIGLLRQQGLQPGMTSAFVEELRALARSPAREEEILLVLSGATTASEALARYAPAARGIPGGAQA